MTDVSSSLVPNGYIPLGGHYHHPHQQHQQQQSYHHHDQRVAHPHHRSSSSGGGGDGAAAAVASTIIKFDPEMIRRRCRSIPNCQEIPMKTTTTTTNNNNTKDLIISFLVIPQSSSPGASTAGTATAGGGVVHQQQPKQYRGFSSTSTSNTAGGTTTSTSTLFASSSTTSYSWEDLARITIFCDTGTIDTMRILDGKIRHVIHTNISSYDVLEQYIRYPVSCTQIQLSSSSSSSKGETDKYSSSSTRIMTSNQKDEQLQEEKKDNCNSTITTTARNTTTNSSSSSPSSTSTNIIKNQHNPTLYHKTNDQVYTLKTNMELIHVGLDILKKERDHLVKHLETLTTTTTIPTAAAVVSSGEVDITSNTVSQAILVGTASSPVSLSVTDSNHNPQDTNDNYHSTALVVVGAAATRTAQSSSPSVVSSTNNNHNTNSSDQNSLTNNDDSTTTTMTDGDRSITTHHIGMEFYFSLPTDHMKHVEQCLHDIHEMGRFVKQVSISKGAVFLYGNGGVAYTPAVPKALYIKLNQLQYSKEKLYRPYYVALGSRERFYIAYHNGTYHCKGPKGFEKEMKKIHQQQHHSSSGGSRTHLLPRSVAFGNHYETYFIVYHDGSWSFQGRSIPIELQNKLADRDDRPDLICVHLGPSGEWFLRAANGRMWWGNISDEMDDAIQQLLDDGHSLNFLCFGEDSSYFIGYD